MPSSHRLLVLTTAAMLSALSGCANSRQAGVDLPDHKRFSPPQANAGADVPELNPDKTAPGALAGSVRNWQPGARLQPFWISMTAEASRAKWDNAAQGSDPLLLSGAPTAPEATTAEAEGSESLLHVTRAPEGADFDPQISRDGTFMVFASTQHRPTADIYRKSTNGRTITQLTSDAGDDVMPAISPDGSRIAFASNRDGNWNIYVMGASGGQAVQLTFDNTQDLHPSWSPDGNRIVFSRLGETSGRWEMWVMDVNSGSPSEFIGFGLFPEWCPVAGTGGQGRDKILFQRSRERGDRAFAIWTIDYRQGDASSPTEVVGMASGAAINASWSPDGMRIVYATIGNPNDLSGAHSSGPAARLPNANLWMSAIDGSQRVNLTSGRFMNLMPTWGSDGRIYFVSDRSGVPNVWSTTTEGAIFAATGKEPEKKSDFATVPTH